MVVKSINAMLAKDFLVYGVVAGPMAVHLLHRCDLSVRIFKNKMKQRRMRSDGILEFSYGVR